MFNPKSSLVDDILQREHENVRKHDLLGINGELTPNNYEEFDAKIDHRELSELFVQVNKLQGVRRSFQLYKQGHLFQVFDWYRDREKRKFRINLACLTPKPEQQTRREWKWLTTAMATAIWSLVLIYVATFTDIAGGIIPLQPVHLVSAGVLMGSITVISLLLFAYYKRDITVFRSYQSQLPLVVLDTDKPDPDSFNRLRQMIEQGIEQTTLYKDLQERLVIELRELRRLRDEGVVKHDDYERARETIFNHSEYRAESVRN